MREGLAEALGDKCHEFADLLHSLGVQRNVAKLVTYLAVAGESTSRDIERGSGLRQPEVSIAMRTLRLNNWIREREVKSTEGKGRPSKVYALSTPIDEIIKSIEEKRRKKSVEEMESIRRLRDLASTSALVREP
ncbi:ArsR family transcriptional regulator [Candidatus Methanocrinis natronophilus]|uniref:ArsR family transcriptional regulator n=1 Tax=Candidatus Methanocrinis natronophilus TaxID=3033396 RepID=A0ABT5X9U4_9EURY|nr:ArsR family transcriptional regulator [Candidatus Methanocrinis natronophilus]MDF0591484.1 ArsR family transcriptional regulator [Candidatus Methanocrinis natronophilus]